MAITTRITCKAPWQRWSASDNCDMSQLQPDRSELRVNKGGLNVLPQREQMGLTNPPKAEVTGSNPVGCATLSAAILCCRQRPARDHAAAAAILAVIEGAGRGMRGLKA